MLLNNDQKKELLKKQINQALSNNDMDEATRLQVARNHAKQLHALGDISGYTMINQYKSANLNDDAKADESEQEQDLFGEEPQFGEDLDNYSDDQEMRNDRGRKEAEELERQAFEDSGNQADQNQQKNPQGEANAIPAANPSNNKSIGKPQEDKANNANSDDKTGSAAGKKKEGIKKQAGDALKKYTKQATQAIKKAIVQLFTNPATAPYAWGAVAIIVILLVGLAIFAYYYSNANSGQNGRTPKQAAAPVTQKEAAAKVLMNAGETSINKDIQDQYFAQLKEEATKATTSDNPDVKSQAEEVIKKIEEYQRTSSKDTAYETIEEIKTLLERAEDTIPHIRGRYPVDTSKISGFNSELHLGSVMKPETAGDGHGTYIYYGEGKGDAFDILASEQTDVFPAISGKVVNVTDDGLGHKKIVIKNSDYELLYANIDTDIVEGTNITNINKPIGKTAVIENQNIIHIELCYCGVSLQTTPLDQYKKESSDQTDWGEYLWIHFKKVFELE